ncbi:uncharacterized protein LOC128981948 [Macrosteles quadrilineatus]|uniref:uncharacterized protein LOC128981948 n=1 Tax=Macrosteles quadrilineatus TaxID=74068 RepID=UPI0023E2302A|nr:uncharacterized protein LOC128981948 [Macrosteles quadrilineatus]
MLFASSSVVAKSFRQVSEFLKLRSRPLPCYTLEEVGSHDNYHDCWIILFDKIYNVTDFIHLHPGGESIILEHAGRDATFTFLSAGHSEHMMAVLSNYLVGKLPSCEHIFETEESTTE